MATPAVTPSLRTDDIAVAASASTKNEAGAADRFLKLLVAQMQNQDPLKPMENAEVTSQMAQIQTVSGIERLNRGIEGMASSFASMQSMQGAALVGRGVAMDGNVLVFDEEGLTSGGFELASAATKVTIEFLSPVGRAIAKSDLGPRGAGGNTFDWKLPEGVEPDQIAGFRVVATAGTAQVSAAPLAHDRVVSVLTGGATLMLQLAGGATVPYSQVKSFH